MNDNLRIVCLSDTHGLHRGVTIPNGDVLIHAGDFSGEQNSIDDVIEFDQWLGELPHAHKIIVPGNHDFILEGHPAPKSLFRNATLLINEDIRVLGLRLWGSPVTPLYGGAFGRSSNFSRPRLYANVPDGIDVLVTHGPPYGVLDFVPPGWREGCSELLAAVAEVKPQLHIFGHVHGSYGLKAGPETTFVNACVMGPNGQLKNEPIVIDIKGPTRF